MTTPLPPTSTLPPGWTARVPGPDDVDAIATLAAAHESVFRDRPTVDREAIRTRVIGAASWTRRQVVLSEPDGPEGSRVVAWCSVHDRAAGRTSVTLVVHPDTAVEDVAAATMLQWARTTAAVVAGQRALDVTQLDATANARDARLRRWLTAAGYRRTRTWLQMTRPVDDGATLPDPRAGVVVRRVRTHQEGMPVAEDLQVVHRMLEESFADHFNSYRESFAEFVQRLRESPGHRWDHWWIAEVERDGGRFPGGALVSSVLPSDASGVEGSYVDYIGVHRDTRGLGVAKALLVTVIRDAQERGRNRVGLEVDDDSPTGADGLYRSLGWSEADRDESWHADLHV